jgi:hypothetical protein
VVAIGEGVIVVRAGCTDPRTGCTAPIPVSCFTPVTIDALTVFGDAIGFAVGIVKLIKFLSLKKRDNIMRMYVHVYKVI